MSAHAVTLHLPDSLYHHFIRQAERARSSLESELLRIVEAAAPVDETLPAALENALTALESQPDDELWQAARNGLSAAESERLEALHFQQKDVGLDVAEEEELAELLERYERALLIRAQSARLLRERGHDVSELLVRP